MMILNNSLTLDPHQNFNNLVCPKLPRCQPRACAGIMMLLVRLQAAVPGSKAFGTAGSGGNPSAFIPAQLWLLLDEREQLFLTVAFQHAVQDFEWQTQSLYSFSFLLLPLGQASSEQYLRCDPWLLCALLVLVTVAAPGTSCCSLTVPCSARLGSAAHPWAWLGSAAHPWAWLGRSCSHLCIPSITPCCSQGWLKHNSEPQPSICHTNVRGKRAV